ncbi:MAG: hypothetical protein IJA32_12190, partial [Lachnospiraceae bacterium]|nr:hypothetical protein [Lachnospiraceae bacterium]
FVPFFLSLSSEKPPMRKISFLYFNALEAFLHEIWLFYCEKFLFLRAVDKVFISKKLTGPPL